MWITNREYDDNPEDLRNLCRFVTDLGLEEQSTFDWSLGRVVDWKVGLIRMCGRFRSSCLENLHSAQQLFRSSP